MRKYYYKKYLFLWFVLLFVTYNGFAQQKTITGIITDKNGLPVREAIVSVKEQPEGKVSSDNDGKFVINGQVGQYIEVRTPDQHYKSVKIISDQIVLKMDDKDELVQLGFGMTRRKEEMTSAVGIVKSTDLLKSSAINPANALFGRIPGLSVLENGGVSWENNPDLFIRGVGTFQNASVLVLVDGFERSISSLSLSEIESVAVLKDAAALAIYGLRGANGVLLVTTKRGSGAGVKVDLFYEHGFTRAFRLPNFLDAYGYASSFNQARINDGLSPFYSQGDLDLYKSGESPYLYPNVNWIDEAMRDYGSVDNLNATFQGMAKGVKYFTAINYQTDQGLFGPTNTNKGYSTQLSYNKFNFRTNLDISITKSTSLALNLGGNLRETTNPGKSPSDIIKAIYYIPSAAFPVKTNHGIWGGTSNYSNNPVAQIAATGYKFGYTRELLADARLTQQLDAVLNGLSAEVSVAFDNSATYLEGKTRKYKYQALSVNKDPSGNIIGSTETSFGQDTELSYSSSLGSQWRNATLQGNLKHTKDWGDNTLNTMLLYQQDKMVRNNQFNTFLHELFALNMQFSRSDRYFADLTLSYSGTNVLPKGSRFGAFPAVSVAWKLSNEKWYAKDAAINDLKIRASWGMTGNDLVPQNIDKSKYDPAAGYFFTDNNLATGGYREGQLGALGLTYETSSKANIGIDASMFGSLDLNVDVFYDRRKNILAGSGALISAVIGIPTPLTNAGIVDNKGLEFGATFHKNARDLNYYVNGQFSFVRNKIVAMGEAYLPFDYLKRTGRGIAEAFGLEAVGFFKDNADIAAHPKQMFSEVRPGDIKYKDQNGDGIIDSYDERSLGYNTLNPELYFSASIGFEYKGIGMDALFQGAGNHTLYLNTQSIFWPIRNNTTISDFSKNSWTPETASSATLPRLSTLENANNYRPNNIWFTSGSFLKLRSLELYYNLPASFISKVKLSNARLYVRGTNLFSVDKVKVVDPEAIGAVYPTLSAYNLGVKIAF